MYRCNECLEIFEIPNVYYTSYESYYGVGNLFPNSTPLTLELCPCCGEENIEEIEEEETNE